MPGSSDEPHFWHIARPSSFTSRQVGQTTTAQASSSSVAPSSPKRLCTARTARSPSSARITQEMRIDDVEIISMLMPSAASASNMSAATPGLLLIPAPTSESLAIASSVS